jgi:hypothetical protein
LWQEGCPVITFSCAAECTIRLNVKMHWAMVLHNWYLYLHTLIVLLYITFTPRREDLVSEILEILFQVCNPPSGGFGTWPITNIRSFYLQTLLHTLAEAKFHIVGDLQPIYHSSISCILYLSSCMRGARSCTSPSTLTLKNLSFGNVFDNSL